MKTHLLMTVLTFFILTTVAGRAEGEGVVNTIWTNMTQIEGAVLWRLDSSTSPKGSDEVTRNCAIGYMTSDVDEGAKGAFIPVLTLPAIKNDSYVTEIVKGRLKITTQKTGCMILILNLRNLAPLALTK